LRARSRSVQARQRWGRSLLTAAGKGKGQGEEKEEVGEEVEDGFIFVPDFSFRCAPSKPNVALSGSGSQRSFSKRGLDIRTVRDLLGNADVSTKMIDLHVMKRPGRGAPSPLDLE